MNHNFQLKQNLKSWFENLVVWIWFPLDPFSFGSFVFVPLFTFFKLLFMFVALFHIYSFKTIYFCLIPTVYPIIFGRPQSILFQCFFFPLQPASVSNYLTCIHLPKCFCQTTSLLVSLVLLPNPKQCSPLSPGLSCLFIYLSICSFFCAGLFVFNLNWDFRYSTLQHVLPFLLFCLWKTVVLSPIASYVFGFFSSPQDVWWFKK